MGRSRPRQQTDQSQLKHRSGATAPSLAHTSPARLFQSLTLWAKFRTDRERGNRDSTSDRSDKAKPGGESIHRWQARSNACGLNHRVAERTNAGKFKRLCQFCFIRACQSVLGDGRWRRYGRFAVRLFRQPRWISLRRAANDPGGDNHDLLLCEGMIGLQISKSFHGAPRRHCA